MTCVLTRGTFRHTETQRGEYRMKTKAETGVMCLQAKGHQALPKTTIGWERSMEQMVLQSPQEELILPTSWFLISSLQNCERIHYFVVLGYLVCSNLSQQPQETNIGNEYLRFAKLAEGRYQKRKYIFFLIHLYWVPSSPVQQLSQIFFHWLVCVATASLSYPVPLLWLHMKATSEADEDRQWI